MEKNLNIIGIDLGTTFSAVAHMEDGIPKVVVNREGGRTTPSVIAFEEDELVIGAEALDGFKDGTFFTVSCFKRQMGEKEPCAWHDGKAYTATELSALLLRHLSDEYTTVTGRTIDGAVVTVPAYFTSTQRKATKEAARIAGLNLLRIIDEPTAAATTYGRFKRGEAPFCVVDVGGGTTDISIMKAVGDELVTLGSTGARFLGGKDFDYRMSLLIQELLYEQWGIVADEYLAKNISRRAEGVKKQLSVVESTDVMLYADGGWQRVTVTRSRFEEAVEDLIQQVIVLCEVLLEDINMEWSDIQDLVMVGGTSYMPALREAITACFGTKPKAAVNPDEAIAIGACIIGNEVVPQSVYHEVALGVRKTAADTAGVVGTNRGENGLKLREVTSHSLGILCLDEAGEHIINKIIIPRQTILPCKCVESFKFKTSIFNNELDIVVLQGEDKEPFRCTCVARYKAMIPHCRERREHILHVQYSYDACGIIHVQLRESGQDADILLTELPPVVDFNEFLPGQKKRGDLAVMLCLDVSTSMGGKPIQDACEAMRGFVEAFDGTGVQIGVMVVSDSARVLQVPTANFVDTCNALDSIHVAMTGCANFAHPFDEIKSTMETVVGKKIAIILADGRWHNQGGAVEAARGCNNVGIDTCGVGFGAADEVFLKGISNTELGYYMLDSSSLLGSAFDTLARALGGGAVGAGKRGETVASATCWLAVGEGE